MEAWRKRRKRGKTHEVVRLPYFIRRFLQPSLCSVYPPIAFVNILLHVAHVIVFKPIFALVWRALIFSLQGLAVNFGAGSKVLLGICEKVVRTSAGEE